MKLLNWPNRITVGRILLIVPLVICLLNLRTSGSYVRHIALFLFVVMTLSDALDGYLARRLNACTELGRFLDPVADKLLITCAFVLLALDSTAVPEFELPNWVAVLVIGKDVLTVIGFGIVYATTGRYLVEPRLLGKACTAVQLGLIAFILVAPDMRGLAPKLLMPLSLVSSALAVAALLDYTRLANRFVALSSPSEQERSLLK